MFKWFWTIFSLGAPVMFFETLLQLLQLAPFAE